MLVGVTNQVEAADRNRRQALVAAVGPKLNDALAMVSPPRVPDEYVILRVQNIYEYVTLRPKHI